VKNFRRETDRPVFKAQGWETSPFNLYVSKGRNMWRDLERLCEELKLPFRRPEPFPQNSLQASRLALVGLDAQWGEDFCRSVFRAEFAEGRRIDEPAVLSELLAVLSVDPDPVFAAAQTDAIKAKLRSQTEEALQLGIFGAPSFITMDGELFGVTTVLNARSPGRGQRVRQQSVCGGQTGGHD
jgi:2-hydroxychromene-2-carboxylate isomerase